MFDLNNWGRVLISTIVVFGFVGITYLYMTKKLEGAPVPEVLSILLGALATNFSNVVGYWIGSSSSSTKKDDALANQAAVVAATVAPPVSIPPSGKP